MERTRSLLSEEGVEEEEEEVEEEDEAGRYEAWWQEQLERRVRVAQTCVRSTFSLKCSMIAHSVSREGIKERADRNTFLYDPEHRLLFCRNAKVPSCIQKTYFFFFRCASYD